MKKNNLPQEKNYYLGLDIGTDSVGWAVTDLNYKLLRVNGKNMWGVRLFDEAKQAKDRRLQRHARRRYERRKQRISLLQSFFAPVINAKDPNFFARLDDSNLYGGDKREKTKFSLFSDRDFTDIDFHKKYKTVYHLRNAMMSEPSPDPRLVYLALHHIIKYRGHFLLEGETASAVENISQPLEVLNSILNEKEISCLDLSKTEEFRKLLIEKANKTERARSYVKCFGIRREDKTLNALLKLIAGNSVAAKDLPLDCDDNKIKICFDGDWESCEDGLRDVLSDDFAIIENAKLLYDYSQLKSILGDCDYISQGMKSKYDKHGTDLADLKKVMRKYFSQEEYCAMFRDANNEKETNYTAYSGKTKFGKNGKNNPLIVNSTSRGYEDFIKYVKSVLISSGEAMQDSITQRILAEIEMKTFMPKQVSKSNSTLPYQLNLVELDAILDNAQKYPEYAFLSEKDENGVSVKDKIRLLLKFRMPYYVGPVNNYSKKYWIVRNDGEYGKILPWNYDKIIDLEQTERNFIERMTNKCPYVYGKKVLPKCSLLYEEFMLLNIVNKIKINGDAISVPLKNSLSEYYAERGLNKLNKKILKQWLVEKNEAQFSDELTIEGIDDGVSVHRRTFYNFVNILGSKNAVYEHFDDIEEIIRYATIAGPEKNNLEKWLRKNYKHFLSDEQIKRIKSLSCKGWGRFSREFLTSKIGTNLDTGEVGSVSVLDVLRGTTLNLTEILNIKEYGFGRAFNNAKPQIDGDFSYDIVDESYCSPAVKKQIWQALSIVKELRSVLGCAPVKIFIEVARDVKNDKTDEKKRTVSRYEKLNAVFNDLRKQNNEIFDEEVYREFENISEHKEKLQEKKLFLYFMQNGLDLYSGERIDYNRLNQLYEIDHIYPRSKVKDDSIHDNLVLTYKTQNAEKQDSYPLAENIRRNLELQTLWKSLRKQGLMTEEKYRRLTRATELCDDEIADFINRQLVETRQSTKEVIGILKRVFTDSEIVWSKARNVSDFRIDMKKKVGEVTVPRFVKCRELNDLHHAKDAYLNIVVGNTYNVRYGHDAKYWVKKNPGIKLVSSANLFKSDVKTQNTVAWIAGEDGTMAQVEKTMRSNAVLFTCESKVAKGALFNATIEKKDAEGKKDLAPLKNCSSRDDKRAKMSQTSKYGGYNKETRAYYMLVKYVERKESKKRTTEKVKYKFLGVTAKDALKLTDNDGRISYCLKKGLVNPIILIEKIKVQTMFEFNGTVLTLSCMTGQRLVWRLAQQNGQDEETERYLKKVVNVLEKRKKYADYKVCDKDGVSEEQNIILYNSVIETLLSSRYSGANSLVSFAKKLSSANLTDKFKKLSVEDQCAVLSQIYKSLQCNAVLSDLSFLGEGKNCAKILTGAEFDSLDGISIVHRSVTGLFEKKIPLSDFDKQK